MVRVDVLHLVPHSIPQSYLLSMHIRKDHVYGVHKFVERHSAQALSGDCANFLEKGLLMLALHGGKNAANFVYIEASMLTFK
jgi:hypothetical protein